MLRTSLVIVQCSTFAILGGLLVAQGYWKLGMAQILLFVVQGLLYA